MVESRESGPEAGPRSAALGRERHLSGSARSGAVRRYVALPVVTVAAAVVVGLALRNAFGDEGVLALAGYGPTAGALALLLTGAGVSLLALARTRGAGAALVLAGASAAGLYVGAAVLTAASYTPVGLALALAAGATPPVAAWTAFVALLPVITRRAPSAATPRRTEHHP